MLSSPEVRLLGLLLSICTGSPAFADGTGKSLCPRFTGHKVQHIDIFDGNPTEQAYLAPDDDKTAPNTYTVGSIYEQGRKVTVRCTYDGGLMRDVVLNKAETCNFSEDKRSGPSLVCR
jgi:hypothetical protein